jgi:hypothetical protein
MSAIPQFARMPWYPRDFASSTRGWPLVARAVYRELLDAQWDLCSVAQPGILPDDEESLRTIAGATPAEWKIAWRYVDPKFPKVDGGRINARLEAHRQIAVAEYLGRQRGARATNAKRWGNPSNGSTESTPTCSAGTPMPAPTRIAQRSLTDRSPNRSAIADRVADESLGSDS